MLAVNMRSVLDNGTKHMKSLKIYFIVALLFLSLDSAMAAKRGWLTSIASDIPTENIYRVNVNKVDGKEAGYGVNKAVKKGAREVEVSLVFNEKWSGANMRRAGSNIYYKTISIEVEPGKTYYLGAKVNTDASAEEVDAGTFWEPVIHRVH